MRIQSLSLDFFGRFSGQHYDFGTGETGHDFHIIYGPNEAGKTTTMEAFLRLLYKFPAREPYDFRHQRKNLQISGTLDFDTGARRFTRLPTRSNNLLDASGTPLPEQAIASELGGLTLEDYRSLLCLDDETIEKGGEDIANAKGDIGRLLFSAAAGVADLSAVLDQAQSEADALYRKQARNTRLAELKKDLAEVDAQIRDQDISATAWRKLKQAFERSETEETAAKNERDSLRQRHTELQSLRRAMTLLPKYDLLAEDVASYADYPERLDVSSEMLVSLQTEEAKAQADIHRLEGEIAQLQQSLEALPVTAQGANLQDDLNAQDFLYQRMAAQNVDLPRRRSELADTTKDMTRCAQDLEATCDPVALVLSTHVLEDLGQARQRIHDATKACDTEQQEIRDLTHKLAELDQIGETKAHMDLPGILARADAPRLGTTYATATEALRSAKDHISDRLAALGQGQVRYDTLPPVCPISPAQAHDLAQQHSDLTRNVQTHDEGLREHTNALQILVAQLENLSRSAGVPSDLDAKSAQEARDTLWQTHLNTLTKASAESFEAAMRHVDQIAEARLAGASTLGQLRQMDQDRIAAELRVSQTQTALDTAQEKLSTCTWEVRRIGEAIGMPEIPPNELADWVHRHAEARNAQRKLDHTITEHSPILEKARTLLDALRPLLPMEDPSFETALQTAQTLSDAQTSAVQRREAWHAERARREMLLQERQTEWDQAKQSWDALLQRNVPQGIASDMALNALPIFHQLRELDARRLQTARQVTSMEANQDQFRAAMLELAAAHSIHATDPLEVHTELRQAAKEAETVKETRDRLQLTLIQTRDALQNARNAQTDTDRKRVLYAETFPSSAAISTLSDLRHTVSATQDAIAKRHQMAELRTELLATLNATDLENTRQMLDELTQQDLDAELAYLPAEIDRSETALMVAADMRSNAARDLSDLTDDAQIATLVERKATLELQIEEATLAYLELSLGIKLAEEAIRRYRDAHRGDMIRATETAFSALTNGAYPHLKTKVQGSSEVLLALDPTGDAKQVNDMSKGTRFQLYLALRAAAYEQMVREGTCLPFFCDDIFETFDEGRTRAACLLMEQIGHQGQAIYLTHHKHVLDIAQAHCRIPPKIHYIDRAQPA